MKYALYIHDEFQKVMDLPEKPVNIPHKGVVWRTVSNKVRQGDEHGYVLERGRTYEVVPDRSDGTPVSKEAIFDLLTADECKAVLKMLKKLEKEDTRLYLKFVGGDQVWSESLLFRKILGCTSREDELKVSLGV